MNRSVLFVCYGGGHARLLSPVVLKILAESKFRVTVLALTSAANEFSSIDDPRFLLVGFKDFFKSNRTIKYGKYLALDLNEIIDFEETVSYLGQSYSDLVDLLGEEKALAKYKKEGRQSFLPIESLKKIIVEISPDIVVTTNSPRSEKASLIAANNLGVPTVAIVDMFAVRSYKWLIEYANRICVLSSSVKDYILEKGGKEENILITGNPAFDSLVGVYNLNYPEIKL